MGRDCGGEIAVVVIVVDVTPAVGGGEGCSCVTMWREKGLWQRVTPSAECESQVSSESWLAVFLRNGRVFFLFFFSQKTYCVLFLPQVFFVRFALFSCAFWGSRETVSPPPRQPTHPLKQLKRRRERRGRCWGDKEVRTVGCGSMRPGGAQSELLTRLRTLNGLGVGWEGGQEKKKERGDFSEWLLSSTNVAFHCCFCIQPLDSVKCFNICAIIKKFFKRIVYTGQKCTAL